jgi:hypothetical protein
MRASTVILLGRAIGRHAGNRERRFARRGRLPSVRTYACSLPIDMCRSQLVEAPDAVLALSEPWRTVVQQA